MRSLNGAYDSMIRVGSVTQALEAHFSRTLHHFSGHVSSTSFPHKQTGMGLRCLLNEWFVWCKAMVVPVCCGTFETAFSLLGFNAGDFLDAFLQKSFDALMQGVRA